MAHAPAPICGPASRRGTPPATHPPRRRQRPSWSGCGGPAACATRSGRRCSSPAPPRPPSSSSPSSAPAASGSAGSHQIQQTGLKDSSGTIRPPAWLGDRRPVIVPFFFFVRCLATAPPPPLQRSCVQSAQQSDTQFRH